MGYKAEKIDEEFYKWAKRVSSQRHINRLDEKPVSIERITHEMLKKRSIEDMERELLGEPHIKDILGEPKKKRLR